MNYRKYSSRVVNDVYYYFSRQAELIFSRYLNKTADYYILIELERELTSELMQCWYGQFPWDNNERDFRVKVTNKFGEVNCELPEWFQWEYREACSK